VGVASSVLFIPEGGHMKDKLTKEVVVRASGVAVTLAALASIVGAGTKWW
jgi:hypothetical protein